MFRLRIGGRRRVGRLIVAVQSLLLVSMLLAVAPVAAADPSAAPSASSAASIDPSVAPSTAPSVDPSVAPSVDPPVAPSTGPSVIPSAPPSVAPQPTAHVVKGPKTRTAQTSAQAASVSALQLNGTTQYVTFGAAPGLDAPAFTLELWFNWTGAGTTASTGNGGVVAIPLLTKGLHESDGSNLDANWFLGIAGGKLAADFEDTASGLNHPVTGINTITTNVWHHAAATYGSGTWNLYLDGNLDVSLPVSGSPVPRSDSIQHAVSARRSTPLGPPKDASPGSWTRRGSGTWFAHSPRSRRPRTLRSPARPLG